MPASNRHFPNWLRAYIDHTKTSEAPDNFHFWTGVATIAGALRRRVWIDQALFQWTPNFYIVLVGPPGVATKSTTVSLGMRMLHRVPGITFGPDATTWQKLTQALQEAVESVTTVDPAGHEVKHEMSCLTCDVSELGTFFRLEDDAFVSVLIDMWDGRQREWKYETKNAGETRIQNPWINLIGCTTPAWLRQNFPEHMIGGGLTSRIIFVYGEEKRHFIAYPARRLPMADYLEREEQLLADLIVISTLAGEYRLTERAMDWGEAWYKMHWTQKPLHLASDRYSGYIGRKQGHLHKLAIVLAAARHNQLLIDAEDLILANEVLTTTEPHMIKVFESVGVVDEAKHMHELLSFVRSYGWLTGNDLWRLCMNAMPKKLFDAALKNAVESGLLVITIRDNKRGVELP